MEKHKYDRDELLIRQVLENAYPQNFNITKGVEAQIKPKRIIKKGFVMALIAIGLMAVTVSAAHYMGAFERLTTIVGQERADELIPIEIGNIERVQAPQSNGTAEVSDVFSHQFGGVALELVAKEVSADVAYIYFTLEDLIANRLDGDFMIAHFIVPINPPDNFMAGTGRPEVIHRDANGVITLRSRFEYSGDIEGLELRYHIREIRFGDYYHPTQLVSINLADFAKTDVDTVLLQHYSPSMGTSRPNWEEIHDRYLTRVTGEGLPVLAPNKLDIGFGLDRVNSLISNIGVVEGRLHIQVYNPDIMEGSVSLNIFPKSYADILSDDLYRHISELFIVQFRIAEDGTPYRDTTWGNLDTHIEFVYDINVDELENYILAVSAFGSDRIDVNWNVTFNLED